MEDAATSLIPARHAELAPCPAHSWGAAGRVPAWVLWGWGPLGTDTVTMTTLGLGAPEGGQSPRLMSASVSLPRCRNMRLGQEFCKVPGDAERWQRPCPWSGSVPGTGTQPYAHGVSGGGVWLGHPSTGRSRQGAQLAAARVSKQRAQGD